jgi:peroxiredoxin
MKKLLFISMLMVLLTSSAFAQLAAPGDDNSPKVGALAPDFALGRGFQNVATNLKDFQGKKNVLIMFFPAAFTQGCTTEFTEAGKMFDQFTALNIELVGVSRDQMGSLNKFKEVVGAKNNFVSDMELEVAGKYDAISPTRSAKRYYFLVDKTGKIIWKSSTGQLIPTEKLLGDLGQLLKSAN